jgi:outer membrane protein TolC
MTSQSWAAPLTLQECLQKAKENNPTLKGAAWDTKIAQANIRVSTAALYPRIDVQAGYTAQLEPQAAIIGGFSSETQQADYASAGLSATYTIYDFGRRNARRQQAVALADASSQQYQQQHKDTSLQVIEAYYAILESGRLIQAAKDEVTQVEEHRRVAQVLFEEGVTTRNDVLQADVRLAAARQKLLTITNRRENIWLLLNFLTGNTPAFRGELDETGALPGDVIKATKDDSFLNGRHDIQALKNRVVASEFEVEESRSNFMPELFTRLGLEYVQNDKMREQAIMYAMVGLKINLFDGFGASAIKERAIAGRSKNQDLLRLAELQARLETDSARNDVAVAQERISVAETAIRQSEENLRINKERYRERVGTATEVLDAQTLVTQARTDYYRALYERLYATARLKKAMGEL